MRRIRFDVITEWTGHIQPWRALLRAGLIKRERELDAGFRYDRCIAVHNDAYKERDFKIMASAVLDPWIVLCEYVRDVVKGNQNLQSASPYLFSATSAGFARMCEYERTLVEDSSDFDGLADDYRFYQHIRTMGYHGLGVA